MYYTPLTAFVLTKEANNRNGYMAHGDLGEVKGSATHTSLKDVDGAVDVLFARAGTVSCEPYKLSRDRPPPLPCGYSIHDVVYYCGLEEKNVKNGMEGAVCGPATSAHVGEGVDVYYRELARVFTCKASNLRRTPPPGSRQALDAAAVERALQREREEAIKDARKETLARCKEQLQAAMGGKDLERLRHALDAAEDAGCSAALLKQARSVRDALKKAAKKEEKKAQALAAEA